MTVTRMDPHPEPPREPRRDTPWVIAGGEEHGLPRYIAAIRSGIWIIVGALAACVIAAGLYLSHADKVYEASADLLVTPVQDPTVPVPGLIVASSDPTRDVETVSRLVSSPSVARRVKAKLKLPGDIGAVSGKVSAQPLATSNIVSITARGSTPQQAADIANTFGTEFVADRTERLHQTLDQAISRLQPEVQSTPGQSTADPNSPAAQLDYLKALRQQPDPSVRLESQAEPPASQSSPRPVLTMGASIVGGLVLGLLGAFALQLLDPRLRREDQLRQQFRLPILARIPLEKRRRKRPLLPSELSLGALDGYQALRAALTTSRRDSLAGRVVLVTGPSPGDGKTTAAINLASTIAAAGKRVILIEADSRRPSIGRALDMRPEVGLASVITGRRYLVDALMPVGDEDSRLRVLLTSPDEAPAADVLSHLSADTLLLQAQRLADWVIVDSPPLNHVAETIAIARAVDDVLVVVRVGRTNTQDLLELAEMLDQQDITPAGFVVLGGHARQGYY
jgi:Mrp family chromosome partitioning ATPase